MNTEIIIKATAPQHQKVHIEHARIEIMDGLRNYTDGVINTVARNDNFRWSEPEIQEHKEFLARAKRKIEGLESYFNLPE